MFVKVYRYRIRKHNFEKWKKINDAARNIYRKYGCGNSQCLISKEGKLITVLELDYYNSRRDFLRITGLVDADLLIKSLFSEFMRVVYRKHITEEEFETV
jgi:hypothetical protein